jgi:hypothetical protein
MKVCWFCFVWWHSRPFQFTYMYMNFVLQLVFLVKVWIWLLNLGMIFRKWNTKIPQVWVLPKIHGKKT